MVHGNSSTGTCTGSTAGTGSSAGTAVHVHLLNTGRILEALTRNKQVHKQASQAPRSQQQQAAAQAARTPTPLAAERNPQPGLGAVLVFGLSALAVERQVSLDAVGHGRASSAGPSPRAAGASATAPAPPCMVARTTTAAATGSPPPTTSTTPASSQGGATGPCRGGNTGSRVHW